MADIIGYDNNIKDGQSDPIPLRFIDNGDGTYSLRIEGAGGGGGISPNHVFSGANRAAAETARDNYFTTNPDERVTGLEIALVFGTSYIQQIWSGSAWVDGTATTLSAAFVTAIQSVIDVVNDSLLLGSTSGIKNALGRYNPATEIFVFDKPIQAPSVDVEANTLGVGITDVSNFGGFLFNVNNISGSSFQLLDALLTKSSGSTRPNQFWADSGASETNINTVDTTQMTANPLVATYTTQLTGFTYSVKLRTFAEMTNVKIQLRDVASGIITRQYPDRPSFEDDTLPGLTLPSGDVTLFFENEPSSPPPADEIYLGLAPFTFFPNRQLEFTIKADSVSILGNGTLPYTVIEHQPATPRGIAFQDEVRTDEQIQDLMSTTLTAGTNITLDYDDTAGTLTINSTASGTTFNAPRITNFNIQNLPSRVNLNTDLNVQRTITFDVMHQTNIQGNLTLEVTTGDNQTVSTPFIDGENTKTVTFSGIDTSSSGNVTFKLTGTDLQSNTFESNTITTEIRTLQEHEYFYYGLSSSNNPSTIDTSGMTNVEATTGSHIIATGAVTSGQYFILLVPEDHDIVSITDDVLQQDVTDIFDDTSNVRQINGINYNSYVVGPLNAINTENYTIVLQ